MSTIAPFFVVSMPTMTSFLAVCAVLVVLVMEDGDEELLAIVFCLNLWRPSLLWPPFSSGCALVEEDGDEGLLVVVLCVKASVVSIRKAASGSVNNRNLNK